MVCVATSHAPAARSPASPREPLSYKFDRRRSSRREVGCWMPATFADGAGNFGITGVQVKDASWSGMGVRAASYVAPGMTLALHQPGCRLASVMGTVVRCTRDEGGFLLGLDVGPSRAA